ncbi:MAG: hypothetical protein QOG65_977 [Actinomycetota bacterium]|jgi:hypothetical protein|nr:hypothetical protein [Actinomycetota bacterium]
MRRVTVAATASICIAGLFGGCRTESHTEAPTVTAAGGCVAVPNEGAALAWLPKTVPLPQGTYPASDEATSSTIHVGVLVVPLSYTDALKFILAEFPKAGLQMGPGESEHGEAENTFLDGTKAGQFKLRNVYCDTSKSELTLRYGDTVEGLPELGSDNSTSTTAAVN